MSEITYRQTGTSQSFDVLLDGVHIGFVQYRTMWSRSWHSNLWKGYRNGQWTPGYKTQGLAAEALVKDYQNRPYNQIGGTT